MGWNLLKSKTVWGALIVAGGRLLADHSPTSIVEAVGGVLTVAGARDAIAKIPTIPAP